MITVCSTEGDDLSAWTDTQRLAGPEEGLAGLGSAAPTAIRSVISGIAELDEAWDEAGSWLGFLPRPFDPFDRRPLPDPMVTPRV